MRQAVRPCRPRGPTARSPSLDSSFVPWGPDWQDPISGLPPVSDGRSAVRCFAASPAGSRMIDPDNCPDLPFYSDGASASYTEGMRLGRELARAGHGTDHSSTLIVRGCPDGTEVTCVPEVYVESLRWRTSSRRRHRSGERSDLQPIGTSTSRRCWSKTPATARSFR